MIQKALVLLFLSAYFGASLQASAAKPKQVTVTSYRVATLMSEQGETKEAFVFRVAAFLQEWTDRNNAEVCGYLATDRAGRYGISLLTQKSQVMCVDSPSIVPQGMTAVAEQENIHSHPRIPKSGWITITKETFDAAIAVKDYSFGRRFRQGIKTEAKRGFSPDDYNKRGYLVSEGRLYYQKGRGTEVDLGEI